MESEHVLRGIVQHHAEIGKIDEAVQPLGEIVEQVGQIALGGDNPRHVVQHEALLGGNMQGRVHSESPSHSPTTPGLPTWRDHHESEYTIARVSADFTNSVNDDGVSTSPLP